MTDVSNNPTDTTEPFDHPDDVPCETCEQYVCPAAATERRIVEWLRRDAEAWPHSTDGSRVAGMLRNTADRIERGEHR